MLQEQSEAAVNPLAHSFAKAKGSTAATPSSAGHGGAVSAHPLGTSGVHTLTAPPPAVVPNSPEANRLAETLVP